MTALAVLAAALFGVWVYACWRWPFVPCDRCSGTGKLRSWWGGSFRLCPTCSGTARRVRTGRRVLNKLRVLRDESRP